MNDQNTNDNMLNSQNNPWGDEQSVIQRENQSENQDVDQNYPQFNSDYIQDDKNTPNLNSKFVVVVIMILVVCAFMFFTKKENEKVTAEDFKDIITNYENISNYNEETKIRIEEEGVVLTTNIKITKDIKNKIMYSETKSSLAFISTFKTRYYDLENGYSYSKTNDEKK